MTIPLDKLANINTAKKRLRNAAKRLARTQHSKWEDETFRTLEVQIFRAAEAAQSALDVAELHKDRLEFTEKRLQSCASALNELAAMFRSVKDDGNVERIRHTDLGLRDYETMCRYQNDGLKVGLEFPVRH